MSTKIEWAEETWNPIIGCSKISEGCKNCYAEKMSARLASMGKYGYNEVVSNRKFNGQLYFKTKELDKPKEWHTPRSVFVCSMSDLFHDCISDEWVEMVFNAMATDILQPCKHRYMILTKRPQKMYEFFKKHTKEGGPIAWPNVWIGTTVENQKRADERIPWLLKIPAAVRFLSVEPMLGAINLGNMRNDWVHWVICGGETGPGARPLKPFRAQYLKKQCVEKTIPFFFKTWGEWVNEKDWIASGGSISERTIRDETGMARIGKKLAGHRLEGKEWRQFPT